ncbi:MAG: hypothetical protein AAGF77_10395 [Bacteroidota bacterium]
MACATDDPIPISSEDSGDVLPTPPDTLSNDVNYDYMLFTRSPSSANGFITGFDEFPEGAINVTALEETLAYTAVSGGIAYNNYVVNQQKLFGGSGYQRVLLNADKVPLDGAIIETFGGGSAMAILNADKGYYVDFNTFNIQVFNPTSFVRLGEIDLSEAFQIPENARNEFVSLYLSGNRLFACLYTGLAFPGFVYQSEVGSIVAVIDTDTDTFVKNIFFEGTKYPGQPFLRFANPITSEDGTLFLPTQGGLTLDVANGENTPGAILKIPPGSDDFDPNYRFTPQSGITQSSATSFLNTGFLYAGNGIAYTNVLMEDPANGADLINLPLMRWAKLDLINETATLVQGMPANAGLTTGMAYNYQDKVQLVVYNPIENINAVYETDITTDTAIEKFRVTSGGIIYGFYEVVENSP